MEVLSRFSQQRVVELVIESGFSVEQAIKISPLNAEKNLERQDYIGSIEVSKRADLVILEGDLMSDTTAIQQMKTIFEAGIGCDTATIIEKTKAVAGLH